MPEEWDESDINEDNVLAYLRSEQFCLGDLPFHAWTDEDDLLVLRNALREHLLTAPWFPPPKMWPREMQTPSLVRSWMDNGLWLWRFPNDFPAHLHTKSKMIKLVLRRLINPDTGPDLIKCLSVDYPRYKELVTKALLDAPGNCRLVTSETLPEFEFLLQDKRTIVRLLALGLSEDILNRQAAQECLADPTVLKRVDWSHVTPATARTFFRHAKNPTALKYASDDLRNDREMVTCAVKNSPRAIRCASKSLQKDATFIKNLFERGEGCEKVLFFCSKRFSKNKKFLKALNCGKLTEETIRELLQHPNVDHVALLAAISDPEKKERVKYHESPRLIVR